jgi:phosphopantothenoylcysteine decarboxylase/phosphopantothenate--cysteine ligase
VKVLLGVTGGIAAYKAADLVRRLRERDAEVQVVMTDSATRFITPLTLQVLSERPVATNLFSVDDPSIEHIRLARWPDVICVAPVTANTLARFAHGLADDLLSTLWLASRPELPVVLAPAMNTVMWENPLVAANLEALVATGRCTVVPPVSKTLACGEEGTGGLAEVADIVTAILGAAAR